MSTQDHSKELQRIDRDIKKLRTKLTQLYEQKRAIRAANRKPRPNYADLNSYPRPLSAYSDGERILLLIKGGDFTLHDAIKTARSTPRRVYADIINSINRQALAAAPNNSPDFFLHREKLLGELPPSVLSLIMNPPPVTPANLPVHS